VREHSCPSCWFETDRDQNAAVEIQRIWLVELGVVEDESGLCQELTESTPAKNITAAGSLHREVVPASAVIDTGSPKEGGVSRRVGVVQLIIHERAI